MSPFRRSVLRLCSGNGHSGQRHHGHLLSATSADDDSVGLLRDGTVAFVGVLGMVSGAGGVDIDAPLR